MTGKVKSLVTPLVGSHFHPPAGLVLQHLPAGAQLVLEPEPSNPFDAKAIRVLCSPEAIPAGQHQGLDQALGGAGFTLGELLAIGTGHGSGQSPLIWLGFVPDSDGKMCKAKGLPGNREVGEIIGAGPQWEATLDFDPEGKPQVKVQWQEAGAGP
jgi:hypothetical protein